jgi:UDP-glucose 4-epimerase
MALAYDKCRGGLGTIGAFGKGHIVKTLVTGGLGVNGAWVVRELLRQNVDVVVADLNPDFSLLPDLRGHFEVLELDVRDVNRVTDLIQAVKPDVIAHLAVLIAANADPFLGFSINAQGTVNILEATRRANVRRVVFTSSKAVLAPITGEFASPHYRPVAEDYRRETWPGELQVYSACKILSEDAGWYFAKKFGFEFTALRFAAIYGPGKQSRHGSVGIHSRIVEPIVHGESVAIARGGDQKEDMIYVKDVANAVVLACTTSNAVSSIYHIGSGVPSTLKVFGDALRKVRPEADLTIGDGLDYLGIPDRYCVMDISRARRELKFEPAFSIETGVRDYVRYLESAAT